jgi:hypothetical protein
VTLEEKFLTILMLIGPPPDIRDGSHVTYFHAYIEVRKQVGLEDGFLSSFRRWCEDRKYYQRELPPAD